MHSMTIPASVKAIGRAGAGTNNIPVAEMSRRGVPVFNAPGANANAVKELVFAALLLAARNVVPALGYVASLKGDAGELEKRVEDGKKQFAGVELPNRTLGIIGLGSVGSLVADTAIKLGMKVIGFDPEITVDAAWRLPSSVRKANSIEELLRQSDFVTLHVPLLVRGLPEDAPPSHAHRVRITPCRAMPASEAVEPQHGANWILRCHPAAAPISQSREAHPLGAAAPLPRGGP